MQNGVTEPPIRLREEKRVLVLIEKFVDPVAYLLTGCTKSVFLPHVPRRRGSSHSWVVEKGLKIWVSGSRACSDWHIHIE
jgi:hypothetical protein